MEKVDVVDPNKIQSFEIGTWKKNIGELVKAFHKEGLVHGDLRLPNFIFTKRTPHKMMLVDFDWGGTAGEVFFPRGPLARELRQQSGEPLLDRPITTAE